MSRNEKGMAALTLASASHHCSGNLLPDRLVRGISRGPFVEYINLFLVAGAIHTQCQSFPCFPAIETRTS